MVSGRRLARILAYTRAVPATTGLGMDRSGFGHSGRILDVPEEGNDMTSIRNRILGLGAGIAALGLVASGGGTAVAQDATPGSDTEMAVGSAHPAHIHVGNCDTLDPTPLVPLADVVFLGAGAVESDAAASPEASPVAESATPMAETATGSALAIEGGHSTTSVALPLNDILAAEHAINIHLSAEQLDVYVACGAIGGAPDANGDLFIGLQAQNDSGVSGIAWLHDNGNGASTTVTLVLGMELTPAGDAIETAAPAASPEASPEATPAA